MRHARRKGIPSYQASKHAQRLLDGYLYLQFTIGTQNDKRWIKPPIRV